MELSYHSSYVANPFGHQLTANLIPWSSKVYFLSNNRDLKQEVSEFLPTRVGGAPAPPPQRYQEHSSKPFGSQP